METDQLINEWLASRSKAEGTKAGYSADVIAFFEFTGKISLPEIELSDLIRFDSYLKQKYEPATHQRKLSSIRSLFAFASTRQLISDNFAVLITPPKRKDDLGERLVDEDTIQKLITATEENPRNALLIRAMYITAGRVSEVLALRWRDLQPQDEGGRACIYGKGKKTRYVQIPTQLWADLMAIRGEAEPDTKVFTICRQHVWRVVKQIARKACVTPDISPHWFRHAHASHALDEGATMAEIRDTLGHTDIRTTSRYAHAKPSSSSSMRLKIS